MTTDRRERVERAALNQSLFREVNERLEQMATEFQEIAKTAVFTCECADVTCVEQIEMSLDEYEALRSEPNQFAVLSGHVYSDVENVIDQKERFVVVAKVEPGASIVAEVDPRS